MFLKKNTMKLKYFIPVFLLFSFVLSEIQKGKASYYSKSMNGRRTYSGEIYYNDSMTAAHNSLKMGSWVRVTNLKNDSVVVVKINDRMSPRSSRIIDLSYGAAERLNFIRDGLANVTLEVIQVPTN